METKTKKQSFLTRDIRLWSRKREEEYTWTPRRKLIAMAMIVVMFGLPIFVVAAATSVA